MFELFKQLGALLANSVSSDLTSDERRVARAVLVKIGWRVSVIGALLWSFGWFAFVGLGSGFARADDVKDMIEEANKPLQSKLAEYQAELKVLSARVKQSLSETKAAEIRALRYKQCLAPSQERESFNNELVRKRNEYRDITGSSYDVRCDEVM